MSEERENTLLLKFPEQLDAMNTPQYMNRFLGEVDAAPGDVAVVCDLMATDYISSSGLRLIMKLAKMRKNLSLINVGPEVYDVFDMTGLRSTISIQRRIMQIDPIISEPIARGSNGEVYAIKKDIIVKMFSEKTTKEEISEEWRNAKTALTLGVPTAICYSLVTDGERLGIMFERMKTTSLATLIYGDYDHFSDYAVQFAELLREMHGVCDTGHELRSVKDAFFELIEHAARLSDKEKEKMITFLDAVPQRDNIVHGDFHPNNIGEVFGELILLDMAEIGYGHPVFDFIASYYDLVLSGQTTGREHPEVTKQFFGLSVDELSRLWDIMVKNYFPGIDEKEIEFFNETIDWMLGFKLLLFPVLHPNHSREKHEQWINLGRERFLDNFDEIISRIGRIDEMIGNALDATQEES